MLGYILQLPKTAVFTGKDDVAPCSIPLCPDCGSTQESRYVREIPGPATYSVKRTRALASINADIKYFLAEINKLFDTLRSSGLNIQIKKRRLEILSNNIIITGFISDDVVSATLALYDSFGPWLQEHNLYRSLNYDFAILWTGYNLQEGFGAALQGKTNTSGKLTAALCTEIGAGVVQFTAYYATVIHTARYIAYILGASSDGVIIRNVMSSDLTPDDEDRWTFSSCAAGDITAFINMLSTNCLLQSSPESITPSSPWSSYTGQLFDPDVICQRRFNDLRSYMCKFPNLYGDQAPAGNIICQSIKCWRPDTTQCVSTFTFEGLVCNPHGRCDDGVCAGDTSSHSSNVDGCECGDHSTDCVDHPRSLVCPEYGDNLCCGYCRGFVGKRSVFDPQRNASLMLKVQKPVIRETAFEIVNESIMRGVE